VCSVIILLPLVLHSSARLVANETETDMVVDSSVSPLSHHDSKAPCLYSAICRNVRRVDLTRVAWGTDSKEDLEQESSTQKEEKKPWKAKIGVSLSTLKKEVKAAGKAVEDPNSDYVYLYCSCNSKRGALWRIDKTSDLGAK
jgi:hypothetical protein